MPELAFETHSKRTGDTKSRPSVGPYSKPVTLAKIDGRRREAKLVREVREELIQHVGGKPSAVQKRLIEHATMLALRLALFDEKFTETGEMTDCDSRTYLAWTNSLTRLLRQLGLKGARAAGPSLNEYLVQRQPEAPGALP